MHFDTLKTLLNASWQSLYTVYHSEVSSCINRNSVSWFSLSLHRSLFVMHPSSVCHIGNFFAVDVYHSNPHSNRSRYGGWNLPIDGETEGFSVAIA